MQVPRSFKCKRVKDAVRIYVVFGVMLQFVDVSNLSSFTMLALIAKARGGCNKVPKIGVEWIICKGNEYIRAQTGSCAGRRIKPVTNGWSRLLEGIV
jgi:hypothetical protein